MCGREYRLEQQNDTYKKSVVELTDVSTAGRVLHPVHGARSSEETRVKCGGRVFALDPCAFSRLRLNPAGAAAAGVKQVRPDEQVRGRGWNGPGLR